jgi:hypothetical protein
MEQARRYGAPGVPAEQEPHYSPSSPHSPTGSRRFKLKGMKIEYYYLKKGDVIKKGDEVEISNSWKDPAKWVPATGSIGSQAPDPRFPAHRKYRRPLKDSAPNDVTKGAE